MNSKQAKKIRKSIKEYMDNAVYQSYTLNGQTIELHPTSQKHLFNEAKKLSKSNG